jgi:hypothetical protein
MRFVLAILVLAAASTASAQGTFEGIVSHTSPPSPVSTIVSGTAGWTFQPTTVMTVTDLGCFNDIFLNNGGISIQVGLWTSGGLLLASNLITSASALINESRYESVTPVGLNAGQTYHIGAYSPGGSISVEVCGGGAGGTVSMGPDVSLGTTALGTTGFGFPPANPLEIGAAYLAPNFRERGVPEPSSALLLGLAALLFVARRRGQRL